MIGTVLMGIRIASMEMRMMLMETRMTSMVIGTVLMGIGIASMETRMRLMETRMTYMGA